MTEMTRNFLIAAALGAVCLAAGLTASDGRLLAVGGACLLLAGLVGAAISAALTGTRHHE